MEGRNSREIWLGFIQAKYLKDAMKYEGKCPTCRSPKDCNNYFCVHCKVGGLCPVAFRAGGEHHRHRWLQVRRQSRMCAVDPNELAVFVGEESTKHIQKCSLNGGTLCYLTRTKTEEVNGSPIGRSKAPGSSSSKRARSQPVNKLMACSGCNRWIPNSMNNKEEFLVCCLQCLMTVAQQKPQRNLLQLSDGALDLTDLFPQTALEKTGCSAKPGDQVPASRALAVIDAPGGGGAPGGAGAREGEPLGRGGRGGAAANEPELLSGLLLITESEVAMARELLPGLLITESEFAVARENRTSGRTVRRSRRIRDILGEPGLPGGVHRRDGQAHPSETIVHGPPSSRVPTDVPAEPSAARCRGRDLLRGESNGTRAGGSGGAQWDAEALAAAARGGFQVADLSIFPRRYRCKGVDNMIAAFMANGEWDRFLGESGRD